MSCPRAPPRISGADASRGSGARCARGSPSRRSRGLRTCNDKGIVRPRIERTSVDVTPQAHKVRFHVDLEPARVARTALVAPRGIVHFRNVFQSYHLRRSKGTTFPSSSTTPPAWSCSGCCCCSDCRCCSDSTRARANARQTTDHSGRSRKRRVLPVLVIMAPPHPLVYRYSHARGRSSKPWAPGLPKRNFSTSRCLRRFSASAP